MQSGFINPERAGGERAESRVKLAPTDRRRAVDNGLLVLMMNTEGSLRETLYNGIELPVGWPPNYGEPTGEPMPVPYLENPPDVISIDLGRQLFVDDFLIEDTTLNRTFHSARMYPGNPVLDVPTYSGGIWYDSYEGVFKNWHNLGRDGIGYATSQDGIHWEKPALDVVEGTNIVLEHTDPWAPSQRYNCDTTSVWIDYEETDPDRRYKAYLTYLWPNNINDFFFSLRYSADGIHWSEPAVTSWHHVGDHTNAHYNPFRKMWVANIRYHWGSDGRCRAYLENRDPEKLTWASSEAREGGIVPWLAADRLDPHHPKSEFSSVRPQLYHFDAIAYESLMLGFFSVHQGPPNEECNRLGIPKRNEVVPGYSRDGFHFHRPNRTPLLGANEERAAWNWGNVQSVGGGCLVVGDELYLYCNGISRVEDGEKSRRTTGLGVLRRDGFASMGSIRDEGSLTTRPVRFSGRHLFVNADCRQGELRAEVLDKNGNVIAPFTKENCEPIRGDETLRRVNWKGVPDIGRVAGEPVRIRFHLRLGELYAFWVSPDESGASHGYVGAGGPGYTGFVDTIGT